MIDVEFQQVRVDRDGRGVLDIPHLLIRGGRTTAILGPNGAGKTTLLRLIAGLERPRQGQVSAGGAAVQRRQHVAYVFQEQVFLRGSVRHNLELGPRLRGLDPAQARARAEEAAALLDVAHLMDRRADQLSGGEGRRVSFARALSMKAPLVLLDEPLAGLDERTYSRLLDELPRLLAAFNATTVLVTHDRHEALRLAQDLVVVVDGKVHAAGDKHEVALRPRAREVAEVLGYTVLEGNGARVAVPPGALKPGAGSPQFAMVVENVLDLVDHLEVTGRVGAARVRVPLPAGIAAPAPGETVVVHAERAYQVG